MLTDILKNAFFGRSIEFLDNLTYRSSRHRLTNWAIANKLKNRWLGRAATVSNEPLIIIGGAPRSGTTLLQMMLKVHNKIDGPYREVCLFEDCRKRWKLSEQFSLPNDELEEMWAESNGDVAKFSGQFLAEYRQRNGLNRVILKAPKAIFLADRLIRHFPNMKFIHIIRDGRDAAVSMQTYFKRQFKREYPFSYGAKTWGASIREGFALRPQEMHYCEVLYEDLIRQPEASLTRVFDFLEEPDYEIEDIVSFDRHIEAGKVATHSADLSQPLNDAAINRWKTEMSADQSRIFDRFAAHELAAIGYARQ